MTADIVGDGIVGGEAANNSSLKKVPVISSVARNLKNLTALPAGGRG